MPPLKFEWDNGNSTKSIIKYAIENDEAESVFEDKNLIILLSQRALEIRYLCIGFSRKNRLLTNYYIIRDGKVRIIGTRVSRKEERELYENGKTLC